MALTDTEVRRAKASDSPYKLADGGGLHLFVTPTGGKLWRWKYRLAGREKLMSFGGYPEVTLATARERHTEARKQLSEGVDPMAERKAVREATEAEDDAEQRKTELAFENVARQWHEVWKEQLVKGRKKSQRHIDTVLDHMEKHVFPVIGANPVDEIEPPDVVRVLKGLDGKFVLASGIHGNISLVFRYAIAHGLCKRNAASDFKTGDVIGASVTHNFAHIDLKKPNALPKLLRDIELYKGEPLTRLATKLLMLTMTRTSELIEAEWSEFDLDNALWTIPAARMKARREHIVPLSRQALELLQLIKQMDNDSKFVFPGRDDKKKPMSNNTILFGLKRMGYHRQQTGHGFRSIASTVLRENGFSRDHVEAQLAHVVENEVEAAYNKATYLEPRRKMVQWYADHLEALQRGKVIGFPTAQAS